MARVYKVQNMRLTADNIIQTVFEEVEEAVADHHSVVVVDPSVEVCRNILENQILT